MEGIETVELPGGGTWSALWLGCKVAVGDTSEQVQVQIDSERYEKPLVFLVSRNLVRAPDLEEDRIVEGQVKVMLAKRIENGTALVKVIGDPMTFGPLIRVPESLIVS